MFWNKNRSNIEKPVCREALQVARFYHEVAASSVIGSLEAKYVQAKYVANELNTFRPYEIAEMVIDRMMGVTDYNEMRKIVDEIIPTFDQCMDDYWLKRYGKRRYNKNVSQND